MAAVKRILFHPEHLKLMSVHNKGIERLFSYTDWVDNFSEVDGRGDAVTILYNERILVCAGHIQLWPGVAEIWAIPSECVAEHTLVFNRAIKRYVESLAKTYNYHRMQTYSFNDSVHDRWMKWLGFECEGILKKYTYNKLDYKMWARLF